MNKPTNLGKTLRIKKLNFRTNVSMATFPDRESIPLGLEKYLANGNEISCVHCVNHGTIEKTMEEPNE